ncbi:MAG: tripartite tricarboxylate transporter substrate binding protein [Pigmentiphaga sp.]|uniref:Bug family tripartite tricarboxylate transporter substrate binding protein n=1 Tax=Pigmentiphaga sp. TaxID=1977564 RepID=UPI0029A51DFE|nr:tripartite tricarboxylate transporter substrate binding protein [Pigmentiphaga sp.]MDX3906360.1 tripartite tricarboxylate transporter substrate binding protein [Pigmentiphaga sp.]
MKILHAAMLLPLATVSMMAAGQASADAGYPNKMVRIVVPFTSGGGTSNTARFLADKLSAKWRQPVIVDNRPGGNTVIGSNIVAKAEPDGYTLLFANTSHTINPSVMPKLPYDTVRDFTPVCTVLINRFVLLTHPSMKANDLDEFIAKLRADPDAYNLPTVGAAGIGRLANESLMRAIGVKLQNIPYKGTSDLATNLMGGQLKFALEIPGFYLPHIKSGKLKALAVSGETRLSSLPDVPTFAEKGLRNFDTQSWYGLLAPAGTPDAIVNKIAADVRAIVASDEFAGYLDSIQSEAFASSPAQFADFIQREMKKNRETAEQAGITAEP